MAGNHRHFKGGYAIEMGLGEESIRKAVGEIEDFKGILADRIDGLAERMAQEGADFAKGQIRAMDAVDTGALEGSIKIRKGDSSPYSSSWIVYTDLEYAQYVEFGTGPRGAAHSHPSGNGIYRTTGWGFAPVPPGWKGATREYKGKEYALTNGMPARPFMWNTAQHLGQDATVRRIAKEAFR